MPTVCKPASPLCPVNRCIRNIAGQVGGNICIKAYLPGADECSVIIIESQRVLIDIVIEICCQLVIRGTISKTPGTIRTHPSAFCITCIVRVICGIKIIVMDCNRFEQTICASTICFSLRSLVVFHPVIQNLSFGRSIIPYIYGFISGRHEFKAGKL